MGPVGVFISVFLMIFLSGTVFLLVMYWNFGDRPGRKSSKERVTKIVDIDPSKDSKPRFT